MPTLGVCLGHQSLAQAFGGKVVRHVPVHGKTTAIEHDGDGPLRGAALAAARSAATTRSSSTPTLPDELEVTATGGGVVMALATASCPPTASSSTPSRCSRRTGSSCWRTSLPNPVLTEAIDALASRRGPVVGADRRGAGRDHGRRRLRGRDGGVPDRAAHEGRDGRRDRRPRRDDARARRAGATGRDDLLDTAGTGGGRQTFNVSTTAALIAAGAGCAVAKHGNRSATGLSGSADVLEALGVRIDLAPEAVARCIHEVGFGFMFAPAHHGATRFVVPVRKELAVRTIFNFLGPLTNPAGATRQVIGVSDRRFLDVMAEALARLGARKALVVSSADGLDEMSTSGTTRVVEVDGAALRAYEVAPEDLGLARAASDASRAARLSATRRHAAHPRRRARPGARPRGAQRRRRDLRRRPRGRSTRASAPPRMPSTPAARAPRSTASPR